MRFHLLSRSPAVVGPPRPTHGDDEPGPPGGATGRHLCRTLAAPHIRMGGAHRRRRIVQHPGQCLSPPLLTASSLPRAPAPGPDRVRSPYRGPAGTSVPPLVASAQLRPPSAGELRSPTGRARRGGTAGHLGRTGNAVDGGRERHDRSRRAGTPSPHLRPAPSARRTGFSAYVSAG